MSKRKRIKNNFELILIMLLIFLIGALESTCEREEKKTSKPSIVDSLSNYTGVNEMYKDSINH